jgi:hypothetical protein
MRSERAMASRLPVPGIWSITSLTPAWTAGDRAKISRMMRRSAPSTTEATMVAPPRDWAAASKIVRYTRVVTAGSILKVVTMK